MKLASAAQIAFIVAASLFVYSFVATAKDGETRRACASLCALKPHYAHQNRRAPDFELPNLQGKTRKLSDYRGKVVILNFWSKSCPPCLEEMPSLASLGHSLSGRDDIVLLTITTDESAEDARSTLTSLLGTQAPFEVLIDPDAEVVTDKFGSKLYPETWFIDGDGIIRARVDGARDWSSALTLSFAESLASPLACNMHFDGQKPSGSDAGLCKEMGH